MNRVWLPYKLGSSLIVDGPKGRIVCCHISHSVLAQLFEPMRSLNLTNLFKFSLFPELGVRYDPTCCRSDCGSFAAALQENYPG